MKDPLGFSKTPRVCSLWGGWGRSHIRRIDNGALAYRRMRGRNSGPTECNTPVEMLALNSLSPG